MSAGLAAYTAHVMPYQYLILFLLLFKGFFRACVYAVRLLALPAHKSVSRQFRYRNNAVIIGVIQVTAFNNAVFALARSAGIEVDKKLFFLHATSSTAAVSLSTAAVSYLPRR